jgi:hypothetical protein
VAVAVESRVDAIESRVPPYHPLCRLDNYGGASVDGVEVALGSTSAIGRAVPITRALEGDWDFRKLWRLGFVVAGSIGFRTNVLPH